MDFFCYPRKNGQTLLKTLKALIHKACEHGKKVIHVRTVRQVRKNGQIKKRKNQFLLFEIKDLKGFYFQASSYTYI